jgi:uncharacterized protein YndB with AHSA1/START domain
MLMATKTQRSVNHQYFIRATPDVVFRALSDPRWWTRWLCDRAELSPTRGGAYLMAWNDGPIHTGTVVDFREGERIAFG